MHDIRRNDLISTASEPDEGGLRAPPELHGWKKAWWWFDFIVLVNLARLRFIAILIVIGVVIMKWDTFAAYYEKWTRPANESTSAASDIEYFCPMHPQIVRENNKEVCPICFMPLSKRKKTDPKNEAPLPAGVVNRVQLSPYREVLAGLQTWPVEYLPLHKEIKAVGFIEFNERGQRTVASRSAGRIDKLLANETGQMVNEGDELALVYSPDLNVSMQNLLDAKRRGNKEFIDSSRERLKRLGIDDAQIDETLASGKADLHVKIRSPISGHIITKYVKEGQYVQEGTPLYDVADLSTVWIQAQVYEDDLAFLPVGDEHGAASPAAAAMDVTATTRSFPNEPFHGKLSFIYPHIDQESRTVTVRCELENPKHKLRPGGTAEITLNVLPKDVPALVNAAVGNQERIDMLKQDKVLAVPESAVIDTGSQQLVYRESSPGVFEGVIVTLGPRMASADAGSYYPVLSGLDPLARVVGSGSFLVDAETRLNPAAASLYFGGSGGTAKNGASSVSNVRPSTPQDSDAMVQASLAKLSSEDRQLAEAQKFCPVLNTVLGIMGPPIKLTIEGQPVFICCNGCKQKALDHPQETLAKVAELKKKTAGAATTASENPSPTTESSTPSEGDIKAVLASLPADLRTLAEKQRICPITGNRLGAMGAPIKLILEEQPVLLCCEGCKDEALKDPKATLAKIKLNNSSSSEKQ